MLLANLIIVDAPPYYLIISSRAFFQETSQKNGVLRSTNRKKFAQCISSTTHCANDRTSRVIQCVWSHDQKIISGRDSPNDEDNENLATATTAGDI